jgi:hypothetical protein
MKISPINLFIISSILLQICKQQCITGKSENNKENCHSKSTISTYCCFLYTDSNPSQGMCYIQPITSYDGDITTIVYKDLTYNRNCNHEHDMICGLTNPQTKSDCKKYSTETNSCCFYDYDGISKGCFWYGRKFRGETTQANVVLSCIARRECPWNIFIYLFIISLIMYI